MGKQAGSTNYLMAEVNRLLVLVEEHLSLGKDEWERLAADYNANRPRSWSERDFDSLRRKFKAMYSIPKPIGKSNMPAHIKQAKDLKRAVDDKANVVEMDDCGEDNSDADPEDDLEEEKRPVEPDFSFDYEPDDSCGSFAADTTSSVDTSGAEGLLAHRAEETVAVNDDVRVPFDVRVGVDGLEAFAPSTNSNRRTLPTLLRPRARRQLARRKPITVTILVCAATKPRKFRRTDSVGLIFAHFETHVDVRVHPTTEIWKKRRQVLLRRSARETEALKQKLSGIQNTTSSLGRSLMEMVLLLREENEMKAEGRRVCEEQRRRDELEAREARYQTEKIEAEERRRQDKLEREDRTRRDREDARARMQELAMLIGALTKST
ncbi:hypothetical protein F441_05160 [Phytophthora nicotianae CJ01A1]|uniref:DUF6818 domain-containing protein n=1 Tax=Phytophthora nicotianae CJ01A1 TaxID=1317063 RepID=W2XF43_PHYNI|nr:hypothetical protein F441_05160 [Phytophthora nicotianae CJ01A1]